MLINDRSEKHGLDFNPKDPEGWGDMLASILMVHYDNNIDKENDYDTKGLMEALTAIFEEWHQNPSLMPWEAAYSLAAKGHNYPFMS